MAKGKYAYIRPSGEVRLVLLTCRATIGQVGNIDHENVSIVRQVVSVMGFRPTVRGSAITRITPMAVVKVELLGRPHCYLG